MTVTGKTDGAFRTIGELSTELGVPQHVLRYWETRFPQLRPLQRAGRRRYYRPADVALVRRIHNLLEQEGYTIRGVQKLLGARGSTAARAATPVEAGQGEVAQGEANVAATPVTGSSPDDGLIAIRDRLARALMHDAA